MKYSVCIDMLFPQSDFYNKFAAVKDCNASAVEFWKWSNKDLARIEEELEKNCLGISVFNLDSKKQKLSDDLSRGVLNAGRIDDFLSALEESIPVYKRLGAEAMIVLIGETLDLPYESQIDNIMKCLSAATDILKSENVNLVIEALNDFDRKNYFLPRSAEVFDIIRNVNCTNIKVLLDLYHEQLMAGNLINTIKDNLSDIGHIHIADAPGRHEPGTGEINYRNVLCALADLDYKKYLGFEFRSTKDMEETKEIIRCVQL